MRLLAQMIPRWRSRWGSCRTLSMVVGEEVSYRAPRSSRGTQGETSLEAVVGGSEMVEEGLEEVRNPSWMD